MRKLIFFGVLLLTGCANIVSYIPSFWDDNQAAKIVDVRLSVERIDCGGTAVKQQVGAVRDQLLWFELYSESKGKRQTDVVQMIHPIRETAEDMYKRYDTGTPTKAYCEIKVRIMKAQSQRAAEAVLGRF